MKNAVSSSTDMKSPRLQPTSIWDSGGWALCSPASQVTVVYRVLGGFPLKVLKIFSQANYDCNFPFQFDLRRPTPSTPEFCLWPSAVLVVLLLATVIVGILQLSLPFGWVDGGSSKGARDATVLDSLSLLLLLF